MRKSLILLLLFGTLVKTDCDGEDTDPEMAPYGCCPENATYPAHGPNDLGKVTHLFFQIPSKYIFENLHL